MRFMKKWEILEPADYQAAIDSMPRTSSVGHRGSRRSYTVIIIPPGLVSDTDIEVGVS